MYVLLAGYADIAKISLTEKFIEEKKAAKAEI